MSSKKLIVVFGATGNQGGSVVTSFLKDEAWRIRALTRNPSSAKANALKSKGVEVVQADMDSPESLLAALDGANAIFAVSDFWGLYWDPSTQDKPAPGQPRNEWVASRETRQLNNVADAAAKVSSLERYVLSSLSNATKWSKGKYTHVFHFDSKAQATDYVQQTYPDLWKKTSVYQAGLFLSNFALAQFAAPRKDENGTIQFKSQVDPDVKLPFIAAEEDSGPFVKALTEEPAGKNVIGYREWASMNDFVRDFTKATGMAAEYTPLPKDYVNPAFPDDLKIEFADNFAYFNEYGYEGRDDPTLIHPKDLESPPKLQTIFDYVKKQDWESIINAAA